MASAFNLQQNYGGSWRMLGVWTGNVSTLTTDYDIVRGTTGGCALIMIQSHGSATINYQRGSFYLVKFPYNDTSISVSHVAGDNTYTISDDNTHLTLSGGDTNWSCQAVMLTGSD